jgi:Dyp-type peroxidase family
MLDLSDIQGNILRGYASFPHACFMFFVIRSPQAGHEFLRRNLETITPGEWRTKPPSTLNVALTFEGLRALSLPAESLASFPADFQDGMKRRARALGDVGASAPQNWDEPWRTDRVHVLIMVYARTAAEMQARCQNLRAWIPQQVRELQPAQRTGLLRINGKLTRKEHFGFTDGLTNPDVEGVPDDGGPGRAKDVGNPDDRGVFRKVPIGEFILGYRGEGGEVAPMPVPTILGVNGSYLVLRKLEQDVPRFRSFLDSQAQIVGRTLASGLPRGISAQEFLSAKMFGRWPNGSPLARYPEKPGSDRGNDFGYADDPQGACCPMGAHVRRVNPRDSFFDSRLMSRHRLIRRGITYGTYLPPNGTPRAPRGIMFLAFNSGLDQFEFVQQKWVNHGDDFEQGNDVDPVAGSRTDRGRMTIPGDETTGRRPFLCTEIPQFVYTRGGDYFFMPSLTALRLLAAGQVKVA